MTLGIAVIGAGLAGLAAALSLSRAGWQVTAYEAGPAAGGRCRSYWDRELGCRIDNGNHLLLSGNQAAFGFLREVAINSQAQQFEAERALYERLQRAGVKINFGIEGEGQFLLVFERQSGEYGFSETWMWRHAG